MVKEKTKVVIIGAGISGLTAGIYALKCGFETEIFESRSVAGGELTGWNRNGYHIDGCLHWLTGTKDNGNVFYTMWRDIGAIDDNTEIIRHNSFAEFESDGQYLSFSRNIDDLKKQMLELSPEDKKTIDGFIDDVKACAVFAPPPVALDVMGVFELVKFGCSMIKLLKVMKHLKIGAKKYANKFKHPLIRFALGKFEDVSINGFVFSYASFAADNANTLRGGSVAMTKRIVDKFISLGGKLNLNADIKEIKVVNKKAKIVSADKVIEADYVVPACDVHETFRLLGAMYSDKKFNERDKNEKDYPMWNTCLCSFAIEGGIGNLPHELTFPTDFEFADKKIDRIGYACYDFEPTFAPKGNSIMQIMLQTNYRYWEQLCGDKTVYKKTKTDLGNKLIAVLENKFPALCDKIKTLDITTPMTHVRYCKAYKGSWMSYAGTTRSKFLIHNGRIKGIDNLFMAGQWLMPPGGLPSAITGRWAIQRIAKKEKIKL